MKVFPKPIQDFPEQNNPTLSWRRPLIVGIGGTMRPGSSTERALHLALESAAGEGADVVAITGSALDMPMYAPHQLERSENARSFVDLVGRSDGLIIASPGYHGTVSGLIKNALDYIEDLSAGPRPYLQDRAVGSIACAAGWQATGMTLTTLRSVVHALRGWPTPMGAAINTRNPNSGIDDAARDQLRLVGQQVAGFAKVLLRTDSVDGAAVA